MTTLGLTVGKVLHSPLQSSRLLKKCLRQTDRESRAARSFVRLNVTAGMLGFSQACIFCVVNVEAWPPLTIGSLCTRWVIGLRGYRQEEKEEKRCALSENVEGQKTREEQWPRRVILKNFDTLTECQAETGEWRDENPAFECQAGA